MSALSKPSRSQDGELRFDVTIKHRVDTAQLVAVVAMTFWDERECNIPYTDPEKGERLDRRRITKTSVNAALRRLLAINAEKLHYWSDDFEDDEEAGAWALEHVLRLWPELRT